MSDSWEKLIPGAMAGDTAPFGVHPNDEKRAKDAIKQAKEHGASFEDFEAELVSYCWKKGIKNTEKLEKEIERARKLWR